MQARFKKARRRNLTSARAGVHDCILVLDGLKPDFNVAKIFRSADGFGVREIHLINIPYFDPIPAKGSVRWVPFVQHDSFANCHASLSNKGYCFFALDPEGKNLLGRASFPKKAAFILGHEEFGFSFSPSDYGEMKRLSIPQWGQVQSLNVSIAASIVLYEYVRGHGVAPDEVKVI